MSISDATRAAITYSKCKRNGLPAWVAYEYLLTVWREYLLFWKQKVTVASVLFFVNRYIAVVYYVGFPDYSIVDPVSHSVKSSFAAGGFLCLQPITGHSIEYQCQASCQQQSWASIGIKYFQYFPWAVFSALRVHALSQKIWFLTTFTFFWSVLAFPIGYYGDFHHRSYSNDPVLGWIADEYRSGTGFVRGGLAIANVVVIGVTWKVAYEARKEGSMSSLMRVLFMNGTLYFM
ncbi:hypothetical protein V8D89_007195 [Ganoderma adspersum]